MIKAEIRKQILDIMKKMTNQEWKENSEKIFTNLTSVPEYSRCWVLMSYVSFDKEVNTIPIISDCLAKARTVCVPKIDWKNFSMVPVQIFNEDDIDFSQKIPQPFSDAYIAISEIELVIVPGIAFDKNCNRLGRGKGFYDRFLATCNAIKIGLAFDFQILEQIPVNENDIQMDIIVTETRIIRKP
ncbi:MAG TPA: 5-formyltetrahydrofolate cyclo-ligase [bacterium]|nr:5-formyltetrahydrofolate cyclo-ligase [bacterium]HOL35342.1 5-formyltetrahydrofolate cyclo-ligase [bacterium]HPP08531.1 5-formyltetrahydrofolate cyclo-ligase [bacterium]